MPISDRLDQIEGRADKAYDDVSNERRSVTACMVTADDLPALVAALRAVLGLHKPHEQTGKCEECTVAPYSLHAIAYPCPTVRAIEAALGEGT